MSCRILITGSEGLIGTALGAALAARGAAVAGLDLRGAGGAAGDVRDRERVRRAVAGCHGVVHLAAVSRVIWGERDPQGCWDTNVGGLRNVVAAAMAESPAPWLIFASSREVYGQAQSLPVGEDAPLCPLNAYGRSKVEGEQLVQQAQSRGLRAAIVRLSNVYGCTRDHADRVIPAFARAAVGGRPLRVDGAHRTFDFTHIDDTIRGLVALSELLARGQAPPPPIQLVTGRPTSLGQLARLAVRLAGTEALIRPGPPRSYDVSHFHGCPERARRLLAWTPRVELGAGLRRLLDDYRLELGARRQAEGLP